MAPSPSAYAASSSTSELAPVRLPLESLSSVIRPLSYSSSALRETDLTALPRSSLSSSVTLGALAATAA